ncbi:MAG: peptidase T [Bacteroidales bacterium]|jgi:tripeptide aminopeptidase|nr:peptidase T [Bacteroidales bacterium]
MKNAIKERFLRYIAIDTQSNPESTTYPSTDKQIEFGKFMVEELKTIGMQEVEIDSNGYVTATLPANDNKNTPTIGFIAHMDTAPDLPGKVVNPLIVENYDGKDIVLNKEENIVLNVEEFPELTKYVGQTIIATDGTTLLGADDKAGIVEIMEAMKYLIANPEIKHGKIRVAFTPDEEIGKGVDHFDVEKFGADFAYTLDGGEVGQLEYENFNAAGAKITINGRNIHPGYAKDKMINSLNISGELNMILPEQMKPEYTTGYEGFFHLIQINGTVDSTTMTYIIRDHDSDKFEEKKKIMQDCVDFLNKKYGEGVLELTMTDQYYNMRKMVEKEMHIVDTAFQAMEECNIKPIVIPIRGGTDGSRLSYMGLLCPNIFAGGHNFHGRYEFVPLESMVKATEVIVKIAELYNKKAQ